MDTYENDIISKCQEVLLIADEISEQATTEEINALAAMLSATAEEIIKQLSPSAVIEHLKKPSA